MLWLVPIRPWTVQPRTMGNYIGLNYLFVYRACTVDFVPSFFDTTRGGKQTNALSCR
jgi:hypothetical protein